MVLAHLSHTYLIFYISILLMVKMSGYENLVIKVLGRKVLGLLKKRTSIAQLIIVYESEIDYT